MSAADGAYAYLRAAAAGAAAAGVRHVCICPGSRSTPVALAFARQPALRVWLHLDERAAAYFALGLAKASRTPAAVICTSGTAAANLAPAVVEAYHAGVPLLLLTADRPPEVRGWGAAQTIDQVRLFGPHVKWFADPGVPSEGGDAGSLMRRAVATARAPLPGPVHINLPLREPLLPSLLDADPVLPRQDPAPPAAGEVPALPAGERGVIVAGGMDAPAPAIAELAAATGWPLLADPLSQLRCGPEHGPLVLDSYDACLREPGFAAAMAPDLVLRFGAPPTSKALAEWTRATRRQIVVDPGWRDPDRRAEVWPLDPDAAAAALCRTVQRRADGGYLASWRRADARARAAVPATERVSEIGIFPQLAGLLPADAALVAGNSMPVRDMDGFLPGMRKRLRIFANRGANGIDGVTSTALGVAAALQAPTVLVVGDVSFYHDQNGLLAARRHAPHLLVVLVHNDGGGIFSFLPQASLDPASFEPLFGTPHGLDFRHTAELYGLPHRRADSWPSFRAAVAAWLAEGGTHILEVASDRARNAAEHRAVWAAAAEAVRTCG